MVAKGLPWEPSPLLSLPPGATCRWFDAVSPSAKVEMCPQLEGPPPAPPVPGLSPVPGPPPAPLVLPALPVPLAPEPEEQDVAVELLPVVDPLTELLAGTSTKHPPHPKSKSSPPPQPDAPTTIDTTMQVP